MYKLSSAAKKSIIEELNFKIGDDIDNISHHQNLELQFRGHLMLYEKMLDKANEWFPSKLDEAMNSFELNTDKTQDLLLQNEKLKEKFSVFMNKTEPVIEVLREKINKLNSLENELKFLKSLEAIEDLSQQLKNCKDDEQSILLYYNIKERYETFKDDERISLIKDSIHEWHNELKERFGKEYDHILKSMKYPFANASAVQAISGDVMSKFTMLTKYLFQLELPTDTDTNEQAKENTENFCLPVKLLSKPIKRRFAFHFTGSRQTARIDRPEWFLSQTLTWIKDHAPFIRNHVQPVAEKLQIKNLYAEDEFNTILCMLAAERLHTVINMYSNTDKLDGLDPDAAFSHAVDEALVFNRDYKVLTNCKNSAVLNVLTRAEVFVKWLALEKKYAIIKMDDTLSDPSWTEPVASEVTSGNSQLLWVSRGADWFIKLLKTIENRYKELPQPGHRLQFAELQLELIEEWRARLAQLSPSTPALNAAHHTRSVLLQWAHSLHYLQLHYYRQQFQHFTELQHKGDNPLPQPPAPQPEKSKKRYIAVEAHDSEELTLIEIEDNTNSFTIQDIAHEILADTNVSIIPQMNTTESSLLSMAEDDEDSGVFGELPAMFAHLRDSGLDQLAEDIMMEFKAASKEYKRIKWHALPLISSSALSVSNALCVCASALAARLQPNTHKTLAPALQARLRARVAQQLDLYLFEEVVLESWWNTGGAIQFTHDVERNLLPIFAMQNRLTPKHHLPRLTESCRVLNMDYDEAVRLRSYIKENITYMVEEEMKKYKISHITAKEVLQILNQRTDLNGSHRSQQSAMELF